MRIHAVLSLGAVLASVFVAGSRSASGTLITVDVTYTNQETHVVDDVGPPLRSYTVPTTPVPGFDYHLITEFKKDETWASTSVTETLTYDPEESRIAIVQTTNKVVTMKYLISTDVLNKWVVDPADGVGMWVEMSDGIPTWGYQNDCYLREWEAHVVAIPEPTFTLAVLPLFAIGRRVRRGETKMPF